MAYTKERGLAASAFVEDLIMKAIHQDSSFVPKIHQDSEPTREISAPIHKMSAREVAAILAKRPPAHVLKQPAYTARTVDDVVNPCRREGCRIQELHEAHE